MQNIIFDLGGVLITWDPDIVYKKYFSDKQKVQQFYQETGIHQVNAEMDRGRPFQDALTELSTQFPHYHEPIHLWQTQWSAMIAGPIPDSVKILKLLHNQGHPLYALTNWAAETFFPHIRYKYPFFELFQDIVVSGVERLIKPDPKIYQLLLHRNKLDPTNCIYIDDKPENLTPAQNLGMSTIKFTSPLQLLKDLQVHGIPPF